VKKKKKKKKILKKKNLGDKRRATMAALAPWVQLQHTTIHSPIPHGSYLKLSSRAAPARPASHFRS